MKHDTVSCDNWENFCLFHKHAGYYVNKVNPEKHFQLFTTFT